MYVVSCRSARKMLIILMPVNYQQGTLIKIVLKTPDVVLIKSFNIPTFKGSNLWNALPRAVQQSPSYKEFKYRYRNHNM